MRKKVYFQESCLIYVTRTGAKFHLNRDCDGLKNASMIHDLALLFVGFVYFKSANFDARGLGENLIQLRKGAWKIVHLWSLERS